MKELGLDWLSRKLRHISKPPVYYIEDSDQSGFYINPQRGVYEYKGKEFDMCNGLIIINYDDGDIASTLAHEFRHHWQWCRFGESAYENYVDYFSLTGTYEEKIKQYFNYNQIEHDALMFEVMVAPNETNLYWKNELLI